MTLLAPWLVVPFVLTLLSLGLGLLVERVAGTTLAGALLLPLGFAALVVLSTLITAWSSLAPLVVPAVAAGAAAGIGLELLLPVCSRRVGRWVLGAAFAVFLVYGAPVLLSGAATFTGYVKLDDTSTWLALADRVTAHGRSTAGLAPSSYQAIVAYYLHLGYPLGSFVPLGVTSRIARVDSAWAYQPYLAFQGALLVLGLDVLLRRVEPVAWRRAAIAFVGAQPALLYGYALWGSVKELVTVPLLALLAAAAPPLAARTVRVRALLPFGVAAAALLAVLNLGGAVWILLAVLGSLALARGVPARALLARVGALAAVGVVLAIPALATAHGFIHTAFRQLTGEATPGNLIHPLSVLQVSGIWPSGDFRFTPGHAPLAYALIAVAVAAAVAGGVVAVRHAAVELLLWAGVSLAGCAILAGAGSPWVAAKVFATTSPVVIVVALAGLSFLARARRLPLVAPVALLVAGGVLWSNVLGYHDAWLAPRDQLAELQTIGVRFTGQGPALVNEYQVYGARHFLRSLDPEASGAYRVRPLPLTNGSAVQKGGYADIDELTTPAVLVYRTLVLPSSPVASRPPSVYRLVWKGRYYQVWQRLVVSPGVLDHLPLGTTAGSASIPSCDDVHRLAAEASAASGRIAFVVPPRAVSVVLPAVPASETLRVSVPVAATYRTWIDGSFAGRMKIAVDGHSLGSQRHRIEHPGQLVPFGAADLAAGVHTVELRYSGADWHSGSGAELGPLSRLVLSPGTEDLPVREIAPSRASTLCGRRLDWIEALGPG